MLIFPDPNVETEYTDPNGSVWQFNGTGWVRQPDCPDGGEGGSTGDGMWPVVKPSIDLITIGSNLYEIADDGSVSLYDTFSESAHNPEFCPTDTLLAVPTNSTTGPLVIYDYSTTPFTKVAEFPLADRPSGCAWSSDGKTIMAGRYNKNTADVFRLGDNGWETFLTEVSLAPEIDTSDLDPEERELIQAQNTLVSVIGFGKQSKENGTSFITLLKAKPNLDGILSGNQGKCQVITTGATGFTRGANVTPLIAIENKQIAPNQTTSWGCRIVAHPNADLFALIGVPVSRDSGPADRVSLGIFGASVVNDTDSAAGLIASFHNEWKIGDSPTSEANSPHALMFSPAGNYLAVQRQYSPIIIFRVNSSGILSRLGEINTSNVDAFFQWSADERFFYVRTGTKLARYEFNEGSPTFVDDQLTGLPTFRIQAQGDTSAITSVYQHPHLNRSKF